MSPARTVGEEAFGFTPRSQRPYAPPRGMPRPPAAARLERRGPRSYRRSDERIREDICERLSAPLARFDRARGRHPAPDASDVSVQVQDGKVTLDGTVTGRAMKHQIEDIVDAVLGVREIDNRIRVPRPR